MTQFQFDLICTIIEKGAPVLANELCGALDNFVKSYNAIAKENEKLKVQISELTKDDETEKVAEN